MKRHDRSLFVASPRSRLLAAVTSVVAIGLVALILPASAASGQAASVGGLDAGVLRLRLGSQDHFRFEPATGDATTQTVSASGNCRLSLGSSPSLVSFTAAPGSAFPGFVSDAIGVRGSGDGAGQPCGRIDAGQSLTLNLSTALGGKLIDYAELDVELKFGGTLKITGYLNGTQVGIPQTYSSIGSDSGPDSGDGDNYRIRFPKSGTTLVNRLVFEIATTSGSASLEGGSDGTQACDAADGCTEPSLGQTLATTDSLFHLVEVDGILDCNEQADPQGGGSTPLNLLERLDNVGGATCTPIPYNLDSGPGVALGCDDLDPQCILLQKDLLGQNAQFFWTVTWAPEEGEYQETETEFDFDFDGVFQPIQLCLAESEPGIPGLPPTLDPDDGDAVDPWCVVDTLTELQPDGQVIVTEKYFGGGDPGGKR